MKQQYHSRLHALSLGLIILLLSACAGTPQLLPLDPTSATFKQADGKISLTYTPVNSDGEGRKHTETGRFQWQQQNQRYRFYLSGPFGAGWIQLEGNQENGQSITLLTSQQGVNDHAETPEELLQRHTGYNLPVSLLNWWIQGIPNPNLPVAYQESTTDLKNFTQGGITVTYQRQQQVGGKILPQKMRLTLPQGHAKIVITRWHAGSPESSEGQRP